MDSVIIMPVFGQGPFLCESISSVLNQRTERDYRVILVDDACPQQETVDTCRRFARHFENRVLYWRSPGNRGLAAMRNEGVNLALELWPDVFSVLFFDGDDRLHPLMLDRAVTALQRARTEATSGDYRVGWVYEDADHFGIDGVSVRPHEFSTLFFMAGCANTSSSLIAAEMFHAGLRYREDMRSGGEDWQFWNNCCFHGFQGKYIPNMGFRYRLKPASMSAKAAQRADENRTSMRLSLGKVFHPDYYLIKERRETPRYLMVADGSVSAWNSGAQISIEMRVLVDQLSLYSREPTAPIPQFLFITAQETFDALQTERLLDFVLLRLEMMSETNNIVKVRLSETKVTDNAVEIESDRAYPSTGNNAEIICLSTKLLLDLMRNATSFQRLENERRVRETKLWLRNIPSRSIAADFEWFLVSVRSLYERHGKEVNFHHRKLKWKPFGVERSEMARHFFGASPMLARPEAREEVLIVVQEASLIHGRIHEITLSLAATIRARGHRCSLLVLGSAIKQSLSRHFDGLFLLRQNVVNGNASLEGGDAPLLGLLLPFGTVVSIACASIATNLNQLRRYGRNVLGVLPERSTGATELHDNLIHCFKIFKGIYCLSETEIARAEGLGVAAEQLITSESEFIRHIGGTAAIPE